MRQVLQNATGVITKCDSTTVPLSNKYEILEDHSEEDYQDIKVTEEYTLVQRSPHQTENNRQQERNPSITRHTANNTSQQLTHSDKRE